MKNNKLIKFMMIGALFCAASLKSLDVNVALKGVTDVKGNVEDLSASFKVAQASLDAAKKALDNKDKSAKERAQIAAQALMSGIDTINKFFGSLNTLNTALIGAQIPLASDALNKQLKPRLVELMATAGAMQAALKSVLDLVGPTTTVKSVTMTAKTAPVLQATTNDNVAKPTLPLETVAPQKIGKISAVPASDGEPDVATEDFEIPATRGRNGAVVMPARVVNTRGYSN